MSSDVENLTPEQKAKFQKELQKQFNMFKKRMKVCSKSELVAMLWEQGFEFRKLQETAQELYEHNQKLLGIKKEPTNEESIEETNQTDS